MLGFTALLALALPLPDFQTPPEIPEVAPPETTTPPSLPELDDTYHRAAEALRQRDCDVALSLLDPRVGNQEPDAAFARVVQGLYAHACEDVERARELLFLGGGVGSPLEDWRLLILADVTYALDQPAVAHAALDKLRNQYPESPLRWQARETAARHAWEAGDAEQALSIIERARPLAVEGLAEEAARLHLETLAWEIGVATDRPEVRRRAARQLLVHAPETAEELEVLEAFELAPGAGEVPWARILTPEQLVTRGRSLLDERRPEAAAETLAALPEERRDFDGLMLTAEALTRSRRGTEARLLLAENAPEDHPDHRAAWTWAVAEALEDMSSAYRGRDNLPSTERRALRNDYEERLLEVARLGRQPWAGHALRALFRERVSEDRFEGALEVLTALRRVEPEDDTGAEWLWDLGWEAYERGNSSGAVGYWSELTALYPEDRDSRAARYWSGRAYERLGRVDTARRLYEQVAAADTTDFYRRYAVARLGEAPNAPHTPTAEAWPTDPLLQRARYLSDLGLDELAQTELDVLRPRAEPRAASALHSLILARRQQPRSSIGHIWRAFPSLGSANQASIPRAARELYYPLSYLEDIRISAEQAGLPLPLVLGMIRQESGFDRYATSRVGAKGLMQLMPATGREVAQRLGMPFSQNNLGNPSFNTRLGTTYFRQVLSMFDGDVELALAGYNGGPYRIRRLWNAAGRRDKDEFLEGLPVRESKIYVKRITLLSDSYERLYDLGE